MPSRNHRLDEIMEKEITFNQHAGNRLRLLRLKKGWTLRKLALETMNGDGKMIYYQSLEMYEKGNCSIPLAKLDKICRALGVTISEFTAEL